MLVLTGFPLRKPFGAGVSEVALVTCWTLCGRAEPRQSQVTVSPTLIFTSSGTQTGEGESSALIQASSACAYVARSAANNNTVNFFINREQAEAVVG